LVSKVESFSEEIVKLISLKEEIIDLKNFRILSFSRVSMIFPGK